jgi:RNA processing factor Prp31
MNNKYNKKNENYSLLSTIKEVIGNNYTSTIITYLNKKKIKNKKSKPFSANSISKIVAGFQKNEIVEDAILEMIEEIKELDRLRKERYSNLKNNS